MSYLQIVSGQIGLFIVYMLIGIIAVKSGVLDRAGLSMLSRIITKILLPLMIFTNIVNGVSGELFLSSLPMLLVTAFMFLTLFLASLALTKVFRLDEAIRGVYQAGAMFGNVGFMGIPIIFALFPERGAIYIALMSIVDQLLLWTVGVNLLAPQGGSRMSAAARVRKMINPMTIGIFLALALVLLDVPLPEILTSALTKTGDCATPFAMLYLGGFFCFMDIRKYLVKLEFYGTVLVKMCIVPLVLHWLLTLLLGADSEIAVTLAILSAMPSMTAIAMIAETQGSDGEYAAGQIFFTTICSMATLPMVCYFLG